MYIRKSTPQDYPAIAKVYDYAREYMANHNNPNQWINGYPTTDIIMNDIDKGYSYICEDENGNILGTFCYMEENDPNYSKIYDGNWLNDEPYGVIHRLATNGTIKGVADACFNWCFTQCNNIRVDTHRDNIVMQNIIKKHGFIYCGIIYVSNGTERMAFQKVI